MSKKTRFITLSAMMTALTAVMAFLPGVFFLPVMVAATLLGFQMTLVVSIAFGLISLLYSYLMPTSIVAMAFVEAPWLPIFPRILAGIGAWAVFTLVNRLIKNQNTYIKKAIPISIASGAGSLFNTLFVVGSMLLFMPDFSFNGTTLYAFTYIMLTYGAIEFACMLTLVPPLVLTLKRVVIFPKNQLRQIESPDDTINSD